jgi:hypothetical protein
MNAPANCRLIGRWRIDWADLWNRVHFDLCGPAALTITVNGGEIAFGALETALEVECAHDSIGFHWAGCEEGEEGDSERTAELLDEGTLQIEFAFRNDIEAVLKAKWDTYSTACQGVASGNVCIGILRITSGPAATDTHRWFRPRRPDRPAGRRGFFREHGRARRGGDPRLHPQSRKGG